MKAEQARKLTDEALKELEDALKQGRSKQLTDYLAAMASFHHYSFGNIMLIVSQNPDATRVAGFRAWKKLGRFVKKSEKGIVIIAPMLIRKNDDQAPDGDKPSLRFKAVHVFDVSQTDGEPLPQYARVGGNPNGHTERLQSLIRERGITLEYADDLGGADGCSRGGTIEVLKDLSPAEEFSTIVHELAHEMLHKAIDRKDSTKTARETEAEAVAFVVSQAIGLDASTAASDYIQLYQGDASSLAASLDRIQKTASEIIVAIIREPA